MKLEAYSWGVKQDDMGWWWPSVYKFKLSRCHRGLVWVIDRVCYGGGYAATSEVAASVAKRHARYYKQYDCLVFAGLAYGKRVTRSQLRELTGLPDHTMALDKINEWFDSVQEHETLARQMAEVDAESE